MTQESIKKFINEIYSKAPKKIMLQTKLMSTKWMIFGPWVYYISKITVPDTIKDTDKF